MRTRLISLCLGLMGILALTLGAGLAIAQTEDAEVAFERGLGAFEESQWAEALGFFDEAISLSPDYAIAHHYRGTTLLQLRQPQEAVKALEKAKNLDPNAKDIFLDLGTAYNAAGRTDDAMAAFREEIKRHPDNGAAYYNLGYLLVVNKKYQEALEPLAKARELDPDLAAPARFYEASALFGMGKTKEAEQAFNEVLKMNPSPQLAAATKKYLDAIKGGGAQEKSWGVTGVLLYQYDTNVVTANNDTEFPMVIEGTEISRQEDSRILVTLSGRWRFLNIGDWSAEARYSFYQSFHFELDSFNLQNHAPELIGTRKLSIGGREAAISAKYRAGIAMLGSDLDMYSTNHWVTPSFWIKWTDALASMVSYRFNYEDFDENEPNRDNIAHSIIIDTFFTYSALFGKKGLIRASVGYDYEDAKDESYDIQRPWVRIFLDNSFPWEITTRLGLYYENENHFEDPYDRVDDVFTAELMVFRPIWGPILANINANYRLNNSTESNFEYERTIVGAGLVVKF